MQFPKDGYWNPQGPTTGNLNNAGPHGFAEILYAYTSGTGNNGSAFAGISANTPWYNLTIGLAMLIGRFLFLLPLLAAAGSLAAKKQIPDDERHVADARRPVRRPARRHGAHRRRADVLPGAVARTDCRTLPDAPGAPVLPGDPFIGGCHGCNDTRNTHAGARLHGRQQRGSTSLLPKKLARARPLFDPEIVTAAIARVVRQAEPDDAPQEPGDVRRRGRRRADDRVRRARHRHRRRIAPCFGVQIALWLWFTVLFANFAEAMAEARGKAQADTLRKTKTDVIGKRVLAGGRTEQVPGIGAARGRRRHLRAAATSSPATAKSSRASRRSTSR